MTPTKVNTHSPADIVRYWLIQDGHGTLPTNHGTWPISVGSEQDATDNTLTVYNTGGTNDGRVMQGEKQGLEGVQVQIRATTEPVGWAKARSIQKAMEDALDEYINVNGTPYSIGNFARIGDVLPLNQQKPQSSRLIYVVNAVVNVVELT